MPDCRVPYCTTIDIILLPHYFSHKPKCIKKCRTTAKAWK